MKIITRSLIILLQRLAYVCILAGAAAPCIGSSHQTTDDANDHLIPSDGILDPAYYALLSRKLFVTPANFGRILDLTSGASEISIAIYSERTGSSENALITCTKAAKQLWYAGSDEQFRFTKDPSVNIARIDTFVPQTAAIAVSDGIKRMLAQTHRPSKGSLVTVDGRAIEFSIEGPRSAPARGLLPPYAQGRRTTALHRLANLLRKYCEARPANRAGLAEKIEAEARLLR